MTKISVIIPCYNHGVYVEEAVQSVLEQSFDNFEIIIVNDGSTDTFTNNLLSSFNKPKCRVLTTENMGLSAARNNGIKNSTGEYICCLDADDKYHPAFFEKALEVLERDESGAYGIVTAWVQFFGISDTLWKTLGHNVDGFTSVFQGVRNNIHSSSLFRRCCWEEVGGFDERMTSGYEDWDFWLNILSHGYQCWCLQEVFIYYRQKEESMVTRADEVRCQILEIMYKKHSSFYKQNLVPILLERDWEVQYLHKEIQNLHMSTGKNEPGDVSLSIKRTTGLLMHLILLRLKNLFTIHR